MKIILASNSPRRKELLHRDGYEFEVIPSTVDEILDKIFGVSVSWQPTIFSFKTSPSIHIIYHHS